MSSTPGTDDLSRKERRDQARTERKALEEAERARAAQRRRLIQLGGVLAVVAVVIAIIAIAAGGSGNNAAPKLKATEKGSSVAHASEVQSLLAGIPQHGAELGKPTAPVTMEEFVDLQCPFCRQYTLGVFPTLVSKFVRTGILRIEFHNYDIIGPDSQKASQMAGAVALQNHLWTFADLFYHNQQTENSGYITDQFLTQIASGVQGLDVNKALTERYSPAVSATISKDNALARGYSSQFAGVGAFNGTPSFLVYKTGGPIQLFSPSSLTEAGEYESTIKKLAK
ncbi:MAG TPA: thioredoxin domain-containing protein [Solirubrobacteraceae bacterium]|jgi:protein-disulfide isomerase|nr:thioredoxin domain-containing protein [Solirubrobacteraceae bacterium]